MGRVQYVGAGSAYFVINDEYPIIAVTSSGPGAGAVLVILDKNDHLYSISSTDADFSIVELYAGTKVI